MPNLPEGQKMWVAYPGEIDSVTIVERGTGGHVFKRGNKPKDPYLVSDGVDEFVIGYADLFDSPVDATVAASTLAQKHGISLESNPSEETHEENPVEDEEDTEEEESEEKEEEEEEEEEGSEE